MHCFMLTYTERVVKNPKNHSVVRSLDSTIVPFAIRQAQPNYNSVPIY